MNIKRKSALCSLSIAIATALAAPAAFAGGTIEYVKANTGALRQGETYDRFVIKYREGSVQRSDSASLLRSVNAASSGALPASRASAPLRASYDRKLAFGADVVRYPRQLDYAEAEALIRQISADPAVEYVEPVTRLVRYATPNDPAWANQWGLKIPSESPGGINLPPALDQATGSGVVVAVIDTGVVDHPDLSANVLLDEGYDFVDRIAGGYDPGDFTDGSEGCGVGNSSWHGTHVAGTVAAVTNNGVGVAGVAPDAVVLPVRVLGKCGGWSTDIADGIVWSAGGSVPNVPANDYKADVINMSLGGSAPAACPNVFKDALAYAHQQGVTVVVAAGNSDADVTGASGVGYTLGNCSNDLVVVGGVGPTGQRGGVARSGQTQAGHGSNHGARVDLAAPMGTGWNPGEDQVLSTINLGTTVPAGSGYAYYYGTSMASPHVAGVVALIQSAVETPLTPAEVKEALTDSVRAFPAPVDKPIGAGILDADAAITRAIEGPPEPCDPTVEECGPTATPIANKVPVRGLAGAAGGEVLYSIEVPAGAVGPLSITTSGGSGDVSLYVSFEAEPTADAADHRSERPGNTETVRIASPQAGVYYIKLVGVRAYSNVTLQARHN
ncbi:S8 family serine peptidase [Luteimonas sp. Y-2-2-4F]|nr:S8 family serine peptidase [Luteimonas sp. Y-2-2-4F]MCD9031760.1 S8 family serine peptidase [Luteimonas sp. Y-2-2-4F]